jgi:hypothetical protein
LLCGLEVVARGWMMPGVVGIVTILWSGLYRDREETVKGEAVFA